jgi:hypothetical protein
MTLRLVIAYTVMTCHFPPDSGRVRRVIRRACAACGNATPGGDGDRLQGALLLAAVAAARLPVADRDLPPGQVLELGVQAGLVLLDHQDVMRLLAGDQELGVLALSMQRISGNDDAIQVQLLQQRRELGDLVGLAVHPHLCEHRAGFLVSDCEQVHGLPVAGGVPGAAHRLAIHRHRLAPGARPAPGLQPGSQPRPDCRIEGSSIDCFQNPPDGGLAGRLEPAGQPILADPQRSQDRRRRIRDPLADCGQRLRPGQHRRDRGH